MLVPQDDERGEPRRIQRTVIGIVRDVHQGPADEELADAYVPLAQVPGRFTFVLTRTAGDPAVQVTPFRAAFRAIDPEISVANARPLQTIVDELIARPRFLASLLTTFAVIAAALTLVGVYGVVAYAVRQREREIAVRMALGANPARLTWLFIRQSGAMLATGIVVGLVAATIASRTIESQLYGVRPGDPSRSRWRPPRSPSQACSPSGGRRAGPPRPIRRWRCDQNRDYRSAPGFIDMPRAFRLSALAAKSLAFAGEAGRRSASRRRRKLVRPSRLRRRQLGSRKPRIIGFARGTR